MKLKDAIALIDVDREPSCRYDSPVAEDCDVSLWAAEVGYDPYNFECWSEDFGKRMHKHSVYSWLCTDTVVGLFVYCLDKKPVAIASQSARKSPLEIKFIGQESYDFVKKVVGEYQQPTELELVDLNKEISPEWSVRAQNAYSFNIEGNK